MAQCGAAKISKQKTKQKNVFYCMKLKSSIVCVLLSALQVYLGCQRRFWMLFLTYLNKTLFFASSIFGNDRQRRKHRQNQLFMYKVKNHIQNLLPFLSKICRAAENTSNLQFWKLCIKRKSHQRYFFKNYCATNLPHIQGVQFYLPYLDQ